MKNSWKIYYRLRYWLGFSRLKERTALGGVFLFTRLLNWSPTIQGQLKILGEPNDKKVLIAACEWLTALLPDVSEAATKTVKMVCIVPFLEKNVFLPIEKTILISQSWLINADVQAVGRLLAMGAKYIRKCEKNGLFIIINLSPAATERWFRTYGTN